MTGAKRLFWLTFFLAVGMVLLSHAHGAFESGHMPCGRHGRLDCGQDSDPVFFWTRAFFMFAGGIFSVAGSIVALVRPDHAAGDRDGA